MQCFGGAFDAMCSISPSSETSPASFPYCTVIPPGSVTMVDLSTPPSAVGCIHAVPPPLVVSVGALPVVNPVEEQRLAQAAQQRNELARERTRNVMVNLHADATRAYKHGHQLVFLRYHHKVSIQERRPKVISTLETMTDCSLMAGHDALQCSRSVNRATTV